MTTSLDIDDTARPQAPEPPRPVSRPRVRMLARVRDYGIVAAFVTFFIILSVSSPIFLTPSNLLNLLDQSVTVGILACAMTLLIIAGGFDMSIGATFALTAIVGAQVANSAGTPMGIAAALLVGGLMGAINGALTTVGRVNPFVATIATAMVFRGFALALSGGYLIVVADDAFTLLAQPRVAGVRVTIIGFIIVAVLCMFLLNRTVWGRHLFAVGGNEHAARLSGVNVNRVRASAYILVGIAAAICGLISVSRTMTVEGNIGGGVELTVIAAVLVGGTSVMGGSGSIWRTLLGVLLLQLIGNGFNLLGVEPTYQRIFTGLVIIAAVAWDAWMRRTEQR